MYHFVFQNHKHLMSRYDPRRTVPHSTRGNFNLEHLRKTLGADHKVYGFGQFPLQKTLWSDYRTDGFMLGHVIEVEQPRTAMWIRLNHENFCRNNVRLIEFYQDLDVDWLTEQLSVVDRWDRESANCKARISTIHSLSNTLHRLAGRGSNSDAIAMTAMTDIEKYQNLCDQLDDQADSALRAGSDIMTAVKQHFDSRYTQIKTG